MNHNILRPVDMYQPLSDYQKAEEMIKEEMLKMLHHDLISDPTLNQCGIPSGGKKPNSSINIKPLNIEKHQSYLRDKGYDSFTTQDIDDVNNLN